MLSLQTPTSQYRPRDRAWSDSIVEIEDDSSARLQNHHRTSAETASKIRISDATSPAANMAAILLSTSPDVASSFMHSYFRTDVNYPKIRHQKCVPSKPTPEESKASLASLARDLKYLRMCEVAVESTNTAKEETPLAGTERIDELRPKSSLRKEQSPATDGQKAVKFADDVGLPLVAVKEFKKVNYFEALSEEIKANSAPAISFQSQRVTSISTTKSLSAAWNNLPTSPSERKLVCDFSMPCCDFANFRDRVRRNQVCLENAHILGNRVIGSVRVLNFVFEKSVFVRYTTNNWRTVDEVQCQYVNNANTLDVDTPPTDSFSFEICGRSPIEMADEIQFCIRYEAGGAHHWDNNDGANYVIITSEFFDQRKRVREMEKNW